MHLLPRTTATIEQMYEHNLVCELSGGNRRKVSLAVALLGSPPSVYLDEPSTGLDPLASRYMWRLLSQVAATRRSALILTTHNMLECQAVCARIGIMRGGELVALGDSQHLRSVHGATFRLEVTLGVTLGAGEAALEQGVQGVVDFVHATFTQAATISERHGRVVTFDIPKVGIANLGAAFAAIEESKEALQITSYALSQSTLEQVFLKAVLANQLDKEVAEATSTLVQANCCDYFTALAAFGCGIIPFFTCCFHCVLGNPLTALARLVTINWCYVGWILDGTVFSLLVQDSVSTTGHLSCGCAACCRFFCRCFDFVCGNFWCCCCRYGICRSCCVKGDFCGNCWCCCCRYGICRSCCVKEDSKPNAVTIEQQAHNLIDTYSIYSTEPQIPREPLSTADSNPMYDPAAAP